MEIIKAQSKSEKPFDEEDIFIIEILNSASNPEVSISQAKVKPGVTTMLHRLKETDEKYYVLSGIGKMEIDGRQIGAVTQGDVAVIPKNISQRITNIGSEDLVFLCICSPRFELINYEAC